MDPGGPKKRRRELRVRSAVVKKMASICMVYRVQDPGHRFRALKLANSPAVDNGRGSVAQLLMGQQMRNHIEAR